MKQSECHGCGVLSRPLHFTDKDTKLQRSRACLQSQSWQRQGWNGLRYLAPQKERALRPIMTAAVWTTCARRRNVAEKSTAGQVHTEYGGEWGGAGAGAGLFPEETASRFSSGR